MGWVKKISAYGNRVIESTGEYAGDAAQFGSAVAREMWKKKIRGNDTKQSVETFASFVRTALAPLTQKYLTAGYESTLCAKKELEELPVWFCWLQGEEYMPEPVRLCYARAKRVMPENAKVHLITLKNVKDYVDFPPSIEQKYYQRFIRLPEMTDILRAFLLSAYGGAWMDSTLYIARSIDTTLLQMQFASPKLHYTVPSDPAQGLWNSRFLVVEKNSASMNYVREAFTMWWGKYQRSIDVRQFDYFLLTAYRELEPLRDLIDSVQPNNPSVSALQLLLNEPFSDQKLRALTAQCAMFDISSDQQPQKQTDSQKETYYGYLYRCAFGL